jgi:hypothetical protein
MLQHNSSIERYGTIDDAVLAVEVAIRDCDVVTQQSERPWRQKHELDARPLFCCIMRPCIPSSTDGDGKQAYPR